MAGDTAKTPRVASRNPAPNPILVLAALVVVVAGLRAAEPVMVPCALAILFSIMSAPQVIWLEQRGAPAWVAVLLVGSGVMAALTGFGMILAVAVAEFVEAAPRYQESVQQMSGGLMAYFQKLGWDFRTRDLWGVSFESLIEVAGTMLNGVLGALTNTFLVLLVMVFILLEVAGFPRKYRLAAGNPDADLGRFQVMIRQVNRYLTIKTAVSLATGLILGLWTWVLGVDFPLLWGITAFLLNYIPNVGSIIAAVPALLIAFVQYGWGITLGVAVGYLTVNTVVGNIVEPQLMGRRLGLSALVVLVSLIFWGWVWGPVGMLLAVPLTMIAKIMLEESERYRWIAVLLDAAPSLREERKRLATGADLK